MALSPAQMQEAIIRKLAEKTGRSLEEWLLFLSNFPKMDNKTLVNYLKTEHGLGAIQAQTIAWRYKGEKPYVETEGYEQNLFPQKNQWEIYQSIKNGILSLSSDILIRPCKTYIPFYQKQQIAKVFPKKDKVFLSFSCHPDQFTELKNSELKEPGKREIKQIELNKENLQLAINYIQKIIQK